MQPVDGFANAEIAYVVSGRPLPSSLAACVCTSRFVDVTVFASHANWQGTCSACGVLRKGNLPHSILEDEGVDRPANFVPSATWRQEVFRRDSYRCVYCGHSPPSSGRTGPRIDGLLKRIDLDRIVDEGRLTIDHPVPVRFLKIDGVMRHGREVELMTKTTLVTACWRCNLGRRDALVPLPELLGLIQRVVYSNDAVGFDAARGYISQVHFRAGLTVKAAKAG